MDTLENFWTLESFWTLGKVSGQSGKLISTLERKLSFGEFLRIKVCYLESFCVLCPCPLSLAFEAKDGGRSSLAFGVGFEVYKYTLQLSI